MDLEGTDFLAAPVDLQRGEGLDRLKMSDQFLPAIRRERI
jgi:hypothetical protein